RGPGLSVLHARADRCDARVANFRWRAARLHGVLEKKPYGASNGARSTGGRNAPMRRVFVRTPATRPARAYPHAGTKCRSSARVHRSAPIAESNVFPG